MKIITDLHIHSKYARGCSNRLDVENIWKSCVIKGVDLIGTGDFTHPKWLEELQNYLEENGRGLFLPKKKYLKKWINDISNDLNQEVVDKLNNKNYPMFVLQTEINSVFARGEKKSRIHNCILIDSFDNAKAILSYLSQFGNVESDGRLAVKQDQSETLVWLKSNFPQSIFFPAHIWTPYFGVLGSRFGFESLSIAYQDSLNLIDCIETGLSSDPFMNWMFDELDKFSIISTSDAHSPENFARESTTFVLEGVFLSLVDLSYKDLEIALKQTKYNFGDLHNIEKVYLTKLFENKPNLFLDGTIEFFPQEGKYFGDGHKKCGLLITPKDTVKYNGQCPRCGGKITVGVLHRSFTLANVDRKKQVNYGGKDFWGESEIIEIAKDFLRPDYRFIVPLRDIIREVFEAKRGTKKSQRIYNELIKEFGSEFHLLLDAEIEKIKNYSEKLAEGIDKIRKGNIFIRSGFDGEYGVVSIFDKPNDLEGQNGGFSIQESLF
ncbi:MAG: endonuclease Q family protein [Candidatus Absconditabacteria bacterium]